VRGRLVQRVWAWYSIRGEVVSAGCVKQAAGGLAVIERIACDVGASDSSVNGRDRRSGEAERTDGHHGRVRMRRRAGDDVSIYTSKKQESTEYEMRKGKKRRKDGGGETHR
jgi:hypothetical protein